VNLSSDNSVLAYSFLPKKQDYYRFSGSLTTPPCSEGVRWLVMKNPIEASAAQIKAFSDTMGSHTNRPIQALNGRVVLE
ncbi:MAG: carbonic anhydrase family protein, partial [Vitreoscilla sp.]|nr:carbonic anhydrase family protein [Vitreoscilla sp.]